MARMPVDEHPIEENGDIFVPVRMEAIRLNSAPDFSLYFRPGPAQPFVLYCDSSIPFTADAQDRLKKSRVDRLYIHHGQQRQYHRYLAEHMDDILADRSLDIRKKAEILYDAAQAVVEQILDAPISKETIERGKMVVRHTVDFMRAQDFPIEHLLRAISSDYYLYTHSVNVAAYSVALALHAGFRDAATLREMANGALFHDIGMGAVDFRKDGALTPVEWERMKRHPEQAQRMLSAESALGEIALDIVRHHHERLDGSGYPDHLRDDALSPFVRIVAIADVFDALTTDRPHQKRRKTFPALTLMQQEMPHQIDMDLFRAFVEIMGGKL